MSSATRTFIGLGIGAVAGWSVTASAADTIGKVPSLTPPGITVVDVTGNFDRGTDEVLWRRLGDADGSALYTYDADGASGKPTCNAECATEFPPFIAAKGAVPFGDWSIAAREDGTRQWVYQGHPLYHYSGEDPIHKQDPITKKKDPAEADKPTVDEHGLPIPEKQDDKADEEKKAKAAIEAKNPASTLYSPKEGWRRASFTVTNIPVPADIAIRSVATTNGYALVVPTTGAVMYVFKTAPKNGSLWNPVYAAELAKGVGDFSIVTREDEKRQWAYKGRPLYTYTQDYSRDDINGVLAQKDAQVALVYENFLPAGVKIGVIPFRGPMMVTAQGMTIYTQTRVTQFSGREVRGTFRFNYKNAKEIGPQGCVDDCLETWKPVLAPAKAQAAGFWEVVARPDGKRQWAYKGAPLYTYSGDKKPGDVNGNNLHELIYGTADNQAIMKLAIGGAKGTAASGFYWHVVPLFD